MNAAVDGRRWGEVQRLIINVYSLKHVRHLVLQVGDAARGREFLGKLAGSGWVTSGSASEQDEHELGASKECRVNIGLTYRGLRALELPQKYLHVLHAKAGAFVEGAPLRAAARLGDTGASAAECWDETFGLHFAHVLLSVYANTAEILKKRVSELHSLPGADTLQGWKLGHQGSRLEGPWDGLIHFGFRDGITKVTIKGIQPKSAAVAAAAAADGEGPSHSNGPHEPGEFLLGYPNNDKCNPWLLGTEPDLAAFFRNGSFAAFRKMEQDEAQLRASVARWAYEWKMPQEAVKAKLCGRWLDGSLLTDDTVPAKMPMPKKADGSDDLEALDRQLDFSKDPQGFACPFASHIRRMNPRQDPVVPSRRRPLIRRGMPYGVAFDEDPASKDRGLLGLFFCASLEDQFEHLLADWANKNPMGPDNRSDVKDPLAGVHEDPNAVFDMPLKQGGSRKLKGFAPFVTTRGTLYAFYPSRSALKTIAAPPVQGSAPALAEHEVAVSPRQ